MSLIDWDRTLVLEVPQMDEHHEKLVGILNRCYRAVMLNDPTRELQLIVGELCDYTHYHFDAEEKLMADLGYPQSADHIQAHRKFIASTDDFRKKLEAGESFVGIEVLMFLKEWLVVHIQKSDRSLAEFINR